MATEQKAEKPGSKKVDTAPATAKANGKRKTNKDDVPEKVPIAEFSSSDTHIHKTNGAKSISNSKSKSKSKSKSSEEEEEKVAGEDDVVDHNVLVSPARNGIDAPKKKEKTKKKVKDGKIQKKKQMKEDIEEKEGKLQKKKQMKEDIEEKDDSLLYQIPMSRVSRIIKSEDPSLRITQEAVYIMNKASEKFLQVLTTEAYASAFLDHKKHIDYKHLSSVVGKRRRFDFLSDFVPEKVKAEDALMELQAVEN
ncbi:hypothetical protein R6Q59_027867 [Mikania micrantha]